MLWYCLSICHFDTTIFALSYVKNWGLLGRKRCAAEERLGRNLTLQSLLGSNGQSLTLDYPHCIHSLASFMG